MKAKNLLNGLYSLLEPNFQILVTIEFLWNFLTDLECREVVIFEKLKHEFDSLLGGLQDGVIIWYTCYARLKVIEVVSSPYGRLFT